MWRAGDVREGRGRVRRSSAEPDEFLDGKTAGSRDSMQDEGGDVARSVLGDGGSAAVGVAETPVGAPLADLAESECREDRDDLAGLERRDGGYGRQTVTVWVPTNSVS